MTELKQARIGEKDTRKANRYGWKCLIDKANAAASSKLEPEHSVEEEVKPVAKPKAAKKPRKQGKQS